LPKEGENGKEKEKEKESVVLSTIYYLLGDIVFVLDCHSPV